MVVMAGRQMSSPRAARVKPERWEPDVMLNDDIPADQVHSASQYDMLHLVGHRSG